MSLSSDAAASLKMAFTRATSFSGAFEPSNQIVDSGLPPCSLAKSRTMRAEAKAVPAAALAIVLAMMTLAYSMALGGRSAYFAWLSMRAN
jgi:hypothetical protein